MEKEEGKMTSQERFWQARLLSKEAEHRSELSAIHQQLEALKATTEDAKADLQYKSSRANKETQTFQLPDTAVIQNHQYASIESELIHEAEQDPNFLSNYRMVNMTMQGEINHS